MNLKEKIIKWLKDYSKNNNNLNFVIGVSGGIDSAVVSTICAETNIKTILVSLPIHQDLDQLKRANNHIDWLKTKYSNVESLEINLTDTFESFKKLFKTQDNLSLANTRSRLRMCTLYYVAQTNFALVVGTGNKIEDFGIGFFTKYGDGGVDISPIADLNKTEVRELAKELDINKEIILAKPTDGLWEDNRTDEDQIGASYEELEWAMSYDGDIKNLKGRDKKVYEIYQKFNKQNKHKMNPIPFFKNELH